MFDPSYIATKCQCFFKAGAENYQVWLFYECTPFNSNIWMLYIRGVHGLDFGFFGSGLQLLPTGSGVRFSFL